MRINVEKIPPGIRDMKVGIIGYGLLGKPVAECLRDSGHDVKIGLRSGSRSFEDAKTDGFETASVEDIAIWSDAVFLYIPDDQQGKVYNENIDRHMNENAMLVMAHGYSLCYNELTPRADIDVVIIAPHGPGQALREFYLKGKGIAAQVAISQDHTGDAEIRALMLAKSLGHHLGGISITSARDEVVMDHFSEQIVLCGGIVELMRTAYQTLVNAGYDPESAYESVVRELKYTVDIIYNAGPSGLLHHVSKSALIGSLLYGPDAVGSDARQRIKQALDRIENGEFYKIFKAIISGKEEFDIEKRITGIKDDFS
jgi:ketol-acid reductoisomerase